MRKTDTEGGKESLKKNVVIDAPSKGYEFLLKPLHQDCT